MTIITGRYKNPTIIEALCELYFVNEQSWDSTYGELMEENARQRSSPNCVE